MRIVLPFLLMLVWAIAPAQSNEATSEPASPSRQVKIQKAQKPEEGVFSRALTWARKSAYAMTKGGRAYAESLVRKTPKTFASVRKEVDGLASRVAKNETFRNLDEKRRYVAELWRLRASLDLMALLDARTLQMLTGIDMKTLEGLQKTLSTAAKALGLAPAQTRPVTKPASKG